MNPPEDAERATTSLRDERRQMQDEINRRHILDAAERIFARQGFYEATLREIAAEAEFSTGTIYNFFDGKDDLFRRVVDRKGRGLLTTLEEAVGSEVEPVDKLHALADAQLSYYSRHRDFYRLILRTAGPAWWSLKAELDAASDDRFERAIDIEAAVFAEGVDAGEFHDDDPEMMAVIFLGIMQAYLTQWLLSEGGQATELEERFPRSHLHAMLDRTFRVG